MFIDCSRRVSANPEIHSGLDWARVSCRPVTWIGGGGDVDNDDTSFTVERLCLVTGWLLPPFSLNATAVEYCGYFVK